MSNDVEGHVENPLAAAGAARGMRASDADRLATVMLLQDAMARGLLNPDEASERMARAFAAVHRHDLDQLTTDLVPAAAAADGPPGWRALAGMAVDQLRVSLSDSTSGRLSPARIAAAVLIAVLLMIAVGAIAAAFLTDAAGAPGPRGFGRR